jgi:hypothetical protein
MLRLLTIIFFMGAASAAGATSLPELHVFKNDGIPTHEKYICVNESKCHQMLNAIRYRYPQMSCATKVFIKDRNGYVVRIK